MPIYRAIGTKNTSIKLLTHKKKKKKYRQVHLSSKYTKRMDGSYKDGPQVDLRP